jgi:hypothetical protein
MVVVTAAEAVDLAAAPVMVTATASNTKENVPAKVKRGLFSIKEIIMKKFSSSLDCNPNFLPSNYTHLDPYGTMRCLNVEHSVPPFPDFDKEEVPQ